MLWSHKLHIIILVNIGLEFLHVIKHAGRDKCIAALLHWCILVLKIWKIQSYRIGYQCKHTMEDLKPKISDSKSTSVTSAG